MDSLNPSGAKRSGQEAEKQATQPKQAKMEPAEKPKKTRGPYKKRNPLPKDDMPKELPKKESKKIMEEFLMLSEKDKDYILNLVMSASDDPNATSFDAKHMLILKKYLRPSRKNLNQLSSEDQATMKTCRQIRKRTLKNIRDAKANKPRDEYPADTAVNLSSKSKSGSSSSSSGSDSDSSSDEENEPNAEESVTKTKEPPNSN